MPGTVSQPDYGKFFTPSTRKLVIMSLCTVSLYVIYWFYKNWRVIQSAGYKCNPIRRSILFSTIFAYSCFKHIKKSMMQNNIDMVFPVGILAILFFLLAISSIYPTYIGIIISSFMFLPIIPANRVALAVNQARYADFVSDDSFSAWNWFAIMLSGLVIILIIFFVVTGLIMHLGAVWL